MRSGDSVSSRCMSLDPSDTPCRHLCPNQFLNATGWLVLSAFRLKPPYTLRGETIARMGSALSIQVEDALHPGRMRPCYRNIRVIDLREMMPPGGCMSLGCMNFVSLSHSLSAFMFKAVFPCQFFALFACLRIETPLNPAG